jgi:hypothetical protein
MVRHLVRNLYFAAIAAALVLQGCGKSTPSSLDRPPRPVAAQATVVDPPTSPSSAAHGGWKISDRAPVTCLPREPYQADDPAPWLAELLHAPDPNVRVQALDAWARQPGASLDPVTYALVDPDEMVRARAQEVLEQELARR